MLAVLFGLGLYYLGRSTLSLLNINLNFGHTKYLQVYTDNIGPMLSVYLNTLLTGWSGGVVVGGRNTSLSEVSSF